MKQKKEMMEVTPEERELLERMRNYNKSYPNGYPQLLWDLQEFFDKMVKKSNNGNSYDNPSSSY